MILPDILAPGLHLVLCGTAPSRISAAARAYYASPGNRFWPTLHEVGITPLRLRPEDYARVLGFGIGLTDLCKTECGSDAELSPTAFDVPGFVAKMRAVRPAAIAFDSKTAARAFFGRSVGYGRQPGGLDHIPVFVLPSPSGRARRWWDIRPWQEAGRFVQARRVASSRAALSVASAAVTSPPRSPPCPRR